MAEAHDRGVGDVIPRAPVPLIVERVGAQLNGAEGHGRSWKSVSVATGAYPYINKRGRIGRCTCLSGYVDDLAKRAGFRSSDRAGSCGAAEECSS